MGAEKVKLATIAGLEHARGFFQHEIGESLGLRFTPKIQFELDRSIDRSLEIDQILRSVTPAAITGSPAEPDSSDQSEKTKASQEKDDA